MTKKQASTDDLIAAIIQGIDDVKGEVDQIQTFPADAEEPNIP